jgi:DNA-binding NarL/FixJ family response regulator
MRRIEDSSRPRVLIADDHAILAEALRGVLEKKYSVVGIVGDGRSLVLEANRLKPDVVVVDVGMPLLNGLDAARQVRDLVPNAKVVFLTMSNDVNLAAAAMELGAVAFVLKHSAAQELLTAIEKVLGNQSYLTPELRGEDWVEQKFRARQFSKELTARQREVVQLLAEGCSNKQVASHLNVSEKTVEFHKYHIMQVFNLKSNADLVLFALDRGLISVSPEALNRPKRAS